MENIQYEKFLGELGLNKEQSLVYESLLKNGLMPARVVAQKSGVKRSLAYKILEQLIVFGLVEKRDNVGKITLFFPTHPGKLRDLLQKREEAIKTAEASLGGIMGKMVSDFNLLSGKPNVQFYEGMDGMKKVLEDSLTAQSEIYAYSDIISIEKYISEINKDYVAKRRKFNTKKKGLIFDSPEARKLLQNYNPDITENKFIAFPTAPSHTIMQIYDNKVSYITLTENQKIGVIIEDSRIAALHRNLFEYQWKIIPDEKTVAASRE
ncbi:MAG: helix-turn-helix domain-containing protein [Patescibacteria group bacterium]